LGVHDLEVKNSALLGKWLFKLLTEDGVWQTLLKRKYIGDPLEIWGLAFLGRPDGYEENFLQIWYFLHKRWIADMFLGGLMVRKWSS
jgi:hypothetical protein